MSYVPIVVPPPQPPSPRTRELADLLARVIVDFEQRHPSVTGQEVREASRLAVQASHGSDAPARLVALALGGLLALAVGGFVFLRQSTGGAASGSVPVPVLVIGISIAILALLAIALRRSP
jgi:hypothetical protein